MDIGLWMSSRSGIYIYGSTKGPFGRMSGVLFPVLWFITWKVSERICREDSEIRMLLEDR